MLIQKNMCMIFDVAGHAVHDACAVRTMATKTHSVPTASMMVMITAKPWHMNMMVHTHYSYRNMNTLAQPLRITHPVPSLWAR